MSASKSTYLHGFFGFSMYFFPFEGSFSRPYGSDLGPKTRHLLSHFQKTFFHFEHSLEGRMVSSTVKSHSCVHLILKDGTWVIVRLGWFTAATGLSLCSLFHFVHGHISSPIHTSSWHPCFRYKLYTHSHRKPCVQYFLLKYFPHGSKNQFSASVLFQLLQNLSRTYSIGHQLLNHLFQFSFLRFLCFSSIERSLLLLQFSQLSIQLFQLCLLPVSLKKYWISVY